MTSSCGSCAGKGCSAPCPRIDLQVPRRGNGLASAMRDRTAELGTAERCQSRYFRTFERDPQDRFGGGEVAQ